MYLFRFFFISLFAVFITAGAAQAQSHRVVIVNGGQFGNPLEDANVVLYDPDAGTYTTLDTIHTNSVQDVLIEESTFAYVAAQDSIVKYDLFNEKRVAANAFGAPSTMHMALYGDKLLVGNWYGASDYNLRVFDKNTLAVVDSVAGIVYGAKDFVVVGDTAYVTQNVQTSSFTDTTGFLSVVDLTTFTHVRDIPFSNNGEDLGRLVVRGNTIYGVNPTSNTISSYDLLTGLASTTDAGVDIQVRGNGPQIVQKGGITYFAYDDKIGSYDLSAAMPITSGIVDTIVTSLAMDTVRGHFYLTQTDFFSYSRGKIFNLQGNQIGNLRTGFSPEAVVWTLVDAPTAIENDLTLDWRFYPNPASSILFVEVSEKDGLDIAILDLFGREIQRINKAKGASQLNVSTLTPGVYLIRVSNGSQAWTQKFVKR